MPISQILEYLHAASAFLGALVALLAVANAFAPLLAKVAPRAAGVLASLGPHVLGARACLQDAEHALTVATGGATPPANGSGDDSVANTAPPPPAPLPPPSAMQRVWGWVDRYQPALLATLLFGSGAVGLGLGLGACTATQERAAVAVGEVGCVVLTRTLEPSAESLCATAAELVDAALELSDAAPPADAGAARLAPRPVTPAEQRAALFDAIKARRAGR